MEAARFLKSKHPHSMVEVKDLQSGDVIAVALRPGWVMPPQAPPVRFQLGDRRGLHKRERSWKWVENRP